MICNYNDFVQAILATGFTPGGSNGEGVFTLVSRFGENVRWFTDDPDADPWNWRMRIVAERDDIAYGKFFFNKSGYITRAWLPYFYAVRRGSDSFEEQYTGGLFSAYARRVYEAVRDNGAIAVHDIRRICGFTKIDNAKFEKALTELQMRLFLTVTGHTRRVSAKGEYGWHVSVLDLPERHFGESLMEEADTLSTGEAAEAIGKRIAENNPDADAKQVRKFIYGSR